MYSGDTSTLTEGPAPGQWGTKRKGKELVHIQGGGAWESPICFQSPSAVKARESLMVCSTERLPVSPGLADSPSVLESISLCLGCIFQAQARAELLMQAIYG